MIKLSIGIAITEHNRYGAFTRSYREMIKYLPKEAKLVVVDDASKKAFKEATFRFETNVGIARAKNKCIELIEDCEHIFLFDSDTYPIAKDWHLPYIESEHKHLMYMFKDFPTGPQLNDSSVEYEDDKITAYTHPRGCMLYFHNDCIETVGGMRSDFGRWGVDHLELSERIYNSGLTKYRFMDVKGSDKLIHSMDEHREVVTTVNGAVRAKELQESLYVYDKVKGKTDFVPYKDNNLILTCYFTTLIDPQRGVKWDYDPGILDTLIKSIFNIYKPTDSVDFRCLSDHSSLHELPMVSYVPKNTNPYLAKWIAFRDYIKEHPGYDNIAMLDGSDTEILVNPFDKIDRNKIYAGDEPGYTNNQWLINNHNTPLMKELLSMGRLQLLNAGVLIGHRNIVLEFLDKIVQLINTNQDVHTDMLYFNYVLRKHFNDKVVNGRQVNTVFKSFDVKNRSDSWIKHK